MTTIRFFDASCNKRIQAAYSSLSAAIGSTRAALNAGTEHARIARLPRISTAAPKTNGSSGRTPNSTFCMSLVSEAAAIDPIGHPRHGEPRSFAKNEPQSCEGRCSERDPQADLASPLGY